MLHCIFDMSKYTIYLLPLPEDNVPAYKKLAITAGKVFIKHGALKYREYVGADLAIQGVVPFSKPLKLKPGETVIARSRIQIGETSKCRNEKGDEGS